MFRELFCWFAPCHLVTSSGCARTLPRSGLPSAKQGRVALDRCYARKYGRFVKKRREKKRIEIKRRKGSETEREQTKCGKVSGRKNKKKEKEKENGTGKKKGKG
jgi:hypothetical protein